MTTATTRAAIRAELYDQIPGLGLTATADSLTTSTLTSLTIFADSTLGINHYRGMFLYRPNRVDPDRVKKITTLNTSTGTVTIAGNNYSNTADTSFEIIGLLHPDELNACIERAVRRIYFDTQEPLCGELENYDGSFEASGITNWTASSGSITLTKDTTASHIFSGTQSLRALNAATNQYAESVSIKVFPNEMFYASAIVQCVTGTASLTVRDSTNAAVIGTAITSGESSFAHLWCMNMIPATCKAITIRLGGAESNADLYWNHALYYPRDKMMFDAPTWLDEQYKFLKLREARYSKNLSSQGNGGYDDGTSRYFADWHQPMMYTLDPFHPAANPYRVQLQKPSPQNELWVEGRRPFADIEALATDTATTRAPLNQLYAYARQELGFILKKRYPADKRWDTLVAEANADVLAETQARPEIPMQPIKIEHYGKI